MSRRNQAIRIPREFELPGESAVLHREGDRLIIEAIPDNPLLSFLQDCEPLDVDFPELDDLNYSNGDNWMAQCQKRFKPQLAWQKLVIFNMDRQLWKRDI